MKHSAIDVPVVCDGTALHRIRLGFRPERLVIMPKVPRQRRVRHRLDSHPGFPTLSSSWASSRSDEYFLKR